MINLIINLILGWVGALIVNYLSDELPRSRRISRPHCRACGAELALGYYLRLEACPYCRKKPTARHIAVLILGIIMAGLLYLFPIPSLGNYGALLWMTYFGVVAIIDLEHRLIMHPVSLVGAVLGAIFGIANHGVLNTILGGLAGFGIMLVFYLLGILFVRIASRSSGEEITEVALGFGDVNLAGVLGLLLGWPGVIGGIVLAIFLGGIVSGIFLVVQKIRKRYQAFQALPYGPFLVLSAVILFYLSQIVR
jgi:leader peptidase (prepilin peptidase)/N-methyltransferase